MTTNETLGLCPFCGSQPGPLATEEDGSLVCDGCLARGPKRKFEWMDGQDSIRGRWQIRHSNHGKRVDVATKETMQHVCIWEQEDSCDMSDTWNTQCGNMFTFTEGAPCEIAIDYCCFCGKPIERHDAPKPEEEDDE
uniref:Restriction alleviation protein n=1 Tax=viral metagenome TaxID=1070528 RepID=A0A6H1Z7X5_9ZZZZ